jgi:hypothetical protein
MEAHLLPTKKLKTVSSAKNVFVAVFWDVQGVLLEDLHLLRCETINAGHCCGTLNNLREAVC